MDEQQERSVMLWRQAFVAGLKAAASYRRPRPDSFGEHFFSALASGAQIAGLNVCAEAKEQRRRLRVQFGPLAFLTPDWWTVWRFERRFGGK